jgi:hypothetical protein
MQHVFVFRVILDSADEDVFRDIEVLATQTLEDLHLGILNAFGIAAGEMASFYISDDQWHQGDEVPLVDMGFGAINMGLMHDIALNTWLDTAGKRALYVYDYLALWTFFVEFVEKKEIEITDILEEKVLLFPKTVYFYGRNPNEAPSKDFASNETEKKHLFDDAFENEEDDFGDDEQSFNDYHDEW